MSKCHIVGNHMSQLIWYQICYHGPSYHICNNAFAYTFEPKIWDYSIPVLKVIKDVLYIMANSTDPDET